MKNANRPIRIKNHRQDKPNQQGLCNDLNTRYTQMQNAGFDVTIMATTKLKERKESDGFKLTR
jgi:hypothetical protein